MGAGSRNTNNLDIQSLPSILDILSRYQFHFAHEKDLQDGIETVLRKNGVDFVREFRLSAMDRPDFYIPSSRTVLEIKLDGTLGALLRQISRYALDEKVIGIIVVGTPPWMGKIPDRLCEKRVETVKIWRGLV